MVGAVGVVAGGPFLLAVGLGASMTALQVAIGAVNDLVDAPSDAGRKPGKPIPAGLVGRGVARGLAVAAAGLGLTGALALGGPPLLGLALVVLGIGLAYDLAAKGTAWSWLPFALGIPILPVYGWLGATGQAAGWFALLWPVGSLAGAALAIANARVDVERDRAAGRSSVAASVGLERSWWLGLGLLAVALVVVLVGEPRVLEAPLGLATWAGLLAIAAGALASRRGGVGARERGWQLQATGVAVVAVAWLARLGSSTGT